MTEHEESSLANVDPKDLLMSTLQERLDASLRIAPWDKLDLDSLLPDHKLGIDRRQVNFLQMRLGAVNNIQYRYYPIENRERGMLGGVDVNTGIINFGSGDEDPVETMFFQYVHNPQDPILDEQGELIKNNEGVANVFLQPDGRMVGMVMLPNENLSALYYQFAPDGLGGNVSSYPENVDDALRKLKETHGHIHRDQLPLIGMLSRMLTSASDIWLDRDRDQDQEMERIMKISGDIQRFKVDKDGIDFEGARFFGAPPDEHPLAGLVDERLFPERVDIIKMENYEEFVKSIDSNGYILPHFFRSPKLGLYYSELSPFDDAMPDGFMVEILGYNGITDTSRGIIVPEKRPDDYQDENETPLAVLRHQLVIAAYESLPDEEREEMIETCNKLVDRSADLSNYALTWTETPEQDTSMPHSFNKFSRQQQERMLGGFIAGLLTVDKERFPYWSGPPLHGDGSSHLDWIPEGVVNMLEIKGFHVSRGPVSKVHPPYIRGYNSDGSLDKRDHPFANPDITIEDSGMIFSRE